MPTIINIYNISYRFPYILHDNLAYSMLLATYQFMNLKLILVWYIFHYYFFKLANRYDD